MQEIAPPSHPSPESMPSNHGESTPKLSPGSPPKISPKASSDAAISPEIVSKVEPLIDATQSPKALQAAAPGTISPTSDQNERPSKKRANSDHSNVETETEPSAKRRKVEEVKEQPRPPIPSPTPEPEDLAEIITTSFFDDAPHQLLERSCAVVLQHVGFEGAKKEAMEAFVGEVDSYLLKVLSYVIESMQAARRTQPTPPDFEFAMQHMGLTSRLLKPHLKPPVSPALTQLAFPPLEEIQPIPETPSSLLGKELSGESDRKAKKFIPNSFPAFPSKHTYKSTRAEPTRERDPRKIREKATEAARTAEEALRRLVKVSKIGGHGAKRGLQHNDKKKIRNNLWEQSMADFTAERPTSVEEQSIAVDAGKQFWRTDGARHRT